MILMVFEWAAEKCRIIELRQTRSTYVQQNLRMLVLQKLQLIPI